MTSFWLFLHLLGQIAWLGGAFASMLAGTLRRREDAAGQALLVRVQFVLHQRLIGPGAFATIVSGLFLSLRAAAVFRELDGPNAWLIVMQAAGVLGGLIVLFVAVPTAARLSRLQPVGASALLFEELRRRQAITGSVAGVLGLAALIAGTLVRYGG